MDWSPVSVGLGAIFGALGRYYLTRFWTQKKGNLFPYGTLFVNLTGALVMGIVATLAPALGLPRVLQTFLTVGVLGAYTTFSSYILDTANLFRRARPMVALFYWLGSPVFGFICIELGIWLGKRLIEGSL